MPDFEPVASVSEIPPNGRKAVVFDDRAVLVFRIGNDFYAVEDVCSHDGQPLTDGLLEGFAVECPRHGARFDVRTGRPLCMPAVEPIATFEVQVRGEDVLLRRAN
ncbi:MAG TPA: non-heme iron oxygenase ferredoxin subunit [Planctomycetaceae bacterium]|nr:non-heme iron oxygenase ferredoxin subunit [Planctomycetaceae bacterium]